MIMMKTKTMIMMMIITASKISKMDPKIFNEILKINNKSTSSIPITNTSQSTINITLYNNRITTYPNLSTYSKNNQKIYPLSNYKILPNPYQNIKTKKYKKSYMMFSTEGNKNKNKNSYSKVLSSQIKKTNPFIIFSIFLIKLKKILILPKKILNNKNL